MTRADRHASLQHQLVMPVIRTATPDSAIAVARALVDGGLSVLEVAWNSVGAAEVLAELARWPEVTVSAGTMLSRGMIEDALALGAQFLVSPILLPDLVPMAHAAGVPCALGACSPTEVYQAHRAGSDWIKLFPAAAMGGLQVIRDLREPFGALPWLVSGGVSLANAGDYLDAGAKVLALGGALLPKDAVARGDWAVIRENARAWCQWLAARRPG